MKNKKSNNLFSADDLKGVRKMLMHKHVYSKPARECVDRLETMKYLSNHQLLILKYNYTLDITI